MALGHGAARTVTVLGSTGSVGTSTVDLLAANPDLYSVHALVGGRNAPLLAEQAIRLRAFLAVIADPAQERALAAALAGTGIATASGDGAVVQAAAHPVDWTMAAITGAAGLPSTLAAIRRGGAVALANKEALVCAGEVMLRAVRDAGATLLPVDSEHNAIFQAMAEGNRSGVERIVLTASGGPFRLSSLEEMAHATPEAALRHPVWSMGAKISIDSATMMNKGLELIEAARLFDMDEADIGVLVHPQSVIHGLVHYRDGSVLAQLGSPDMRIPIAHALAWPGRIATSSPRLDLAAPGTPGVRPPRPRPLPRAPAGPGRVARRRRRPGHPFGRQRGRGGGVPGPPPGLHRHRRAGRGGAGPDRPPPGRQPGRRHGPGLGRPARGAPACLRPCRLMRVADPMNSPAPSPSYVR